jgi:hypothetical protein
LLFSKEKKRERCHHLQAASHVFLFSCHRKL